jgi:CRISPR/Cas system endoribonuclease Cas6 (RAMP superfamily)
MISLKMSLMPKGKYLLKDNNDHELRKLCHYLISQNRFDYILNYTYGKKQNYSLETDLKFSNLTCSSSEKNGNYITSNGEVNWIISSHSYNLILQLVQGLYKEESITINNAEFEVKSIEVHNAIDVSALSEVS